MHLFYSYKKILIIIFILFSINSFAEPQKLEFQYTFKDSEEFEKQFPFLTDTEIFKSFKEYEPIAKSDNKLNELYILEFIFNKNKYYIIVGVGLWFCGSSGCSFEVFSKKDNGIIIKDHIPPGDIYLEGNILYFQYNDNIPMFKYKIK